MEQYYKIAGLTVKMDSFGVTEERASRYLCTIATHAALPPSAFPGTKDGSLKSETEGLSTIILTPKSRHTIPDLPPKCKKI